MTVKKFGGHTSLVPTPHTVFITCTVTCCTAKSSLQCNNRTLGTALRGLGTRVGQPPVLLCFIHKLCTGSESSGNFRPSKITVSSKMNSTEVQNPRRKLHCSLCLPYVFDSVLACAIKSAHVFQELSYSLSGALLLTLRTLSLSFLTKNSSSDSKAFLSFIASSGSPTAVHRTFLFFDAKAQTDLFTCTTVLHCGHTFLRHIDLLHSVACTTVLHCGHTFLNLS